MTNSENSNNPPNAPLNNSASSIDVVAGIILNADKTKILMSQRTDIEFINQWEFPGGKIDKGETSEQALVRELKEELSIDIVDYQLYFQKSHSYPNKTINLSFFWVTSFTGEPKGMESQPVEWQDVTSMHALNFLAANKEVVKQVQARLLNS